MSTNLSPENEAILAEAVSRGMFPSTSQALDEAIRLLHRTIAIDEAIKVGLESGTPIDVDEAYWARKRAELLVRYEAEQS